MTDDTPSPCMIVIFGASGDLTRRKLGPSLFDLHRAGELPKRFAVLGISRTKMSDEAFRDHLAQGAKAAGGEKFNAKQWGEFSGAIHYHAADSTQPGDFDGIKTRIEELAQQHGTGQNVLFYLSLSPQLYDPVIEEAERLEAAREFSFDEEGP